MSWPIENYDTEVKCSLVLVCHIPRGFFIDLDEIRSQNASKVCDVCTYLSQVVYHSPGENLFMKS